MVKDIENIVRKYMADRIIFYSSSTGFILIRLLFCCCKFG